VSAKKTTLPQWWLWAAFIFIAAFEWLGWWIW